MAKRNDSEIASSARAEIRLILVGRQGSGKSATGNTILGRQVFNDHPGSESLETNCRHGKSVMNNHTVLVVDTPSLLGKDMSEEHFNREVAKCVLLSSPGPHAIILVINVGRLSKNLQMAPRLIEEIFGADAKRYIIVVLTGGDELRRNRMSKEDFVRSAPDYMSAIFKKFPVVVVNNWANDEEKQRQVKELLSIVLKTNEKCMSNTLYRQIEERLLKAEAEAQAVRV